MLICVNTTAYLNFMYLCNHESIISQTGEYGKMDIEALMMRRINMPEIMAASVWASENVENKKTLWKLVLSDDRLTSVNALWILTHLDKSENAWIGSLRDMLIDKVLTENDVSIKRMVLQLLNRLQYDDGDIRTDFLDWCLSRINAECEPCTVRAYCIHIAFRMCRRYPELLCELEEYLEMLSMQVQSPGLMSARRNTLAAIGKIRKQKAYIDYD